jgi:hypothetical protein
MNTYADQGMYIIENIIKKYCTINEINYSVLYDEKYILFF